MIMSQELRCNGCTDFTECSSHSVKSVQLSLSEVSAACHIRRRLCGIMTGTQHGYSTYGMMSALSALTDSLKVCLTVISHQHS